MTHVTIIGTGNMGTAIGGLFAAAGATVDYVTHEDLGTAQIAGDTVVLAVPHPAVNDILATKKAQLAGKAVVDITNPVNFETFDGLVTEPGTSKAAEIQQQLPDSHVVKAFNTNFAATLASKKVGENQTTVLLAGDNADAKAALASTLTAAGIRAVDAGSLKRAVELEALGFLQITLAAGEKTSWTTGFALL
ncbi:NADPH-dependent F420 reductase [Demequina sp.]|uniref:NADPH-dependent F420 reductase n=1 Tax=Demequina sp. TaxID=2050685 RepID=UPI003D0B44D7